MFDVQETIRGAGAILTHYFNSNALGIEIKDDNSPVTKADYESHSHIHTALSLLTPGIVIISEENSKMPEIKKDGLFWTVDPLDGTKPFIKKQKGFSVQIALMDHYRPVLAAVYCPAHDILYASIRDGESFKQSGSAPPQRLRTQPVKNDKRLRTLFNLMHGNINAYQQARALLKTQGLELPQTPIGEAELPRHLMVAEGLADCNADCGSNESLVGGNGYSWDYAPLTLIAENAGAVVKEIKSGESPAFTNPTQRMNASLVLGDKTLAARIYPGR